MDRRSKDMPHFRFFLNKLDLEFLKGVYNSTVLQAQIYLITNSFGSRPPYCGSYADFVESSTIQQKNLPKHSVPCLLKLVRAHSQTLNQTSCSPPIYTIQIEFGKQKYFYLSRHRCIWAVSAVEF
jgi:hypothetical protein